MSELQAISFISEDVVTQAQFEDWIAELAQDDLHRYELLGGRIVMNPPVGWPEGETETVVILALGAFVVSRNLGRIFGPNQGFELPTGDTLSPDAAFVSHARWKTLEAPSPGKFLRLVPELVVEVLSPNRPARDLVDKRVIYAQAGVREYWVVDQRRKQVSVFYESAEGRFEPVLVLSKEQTLQSRVVPGLILPISNLFAK